MEMSFRVAAQTLHVFIPFIPCAMTPLHHIWHFDLLTSYDMAIVLCSLLMGELGAEPLPVKFLRLFL